MRSCFLFSVLAVLFVASPGMAQETGDESLFNGKDLTGWSYLPTTEAQKKGRAGWQANDPNAPPWPIVESKVSFDGKTESDDGRFAAQNGVLVVTVPAEGRKVQMLYSDLEVEGDFELSLEFRAAENADSGVFVRGRQLQCRDYPNAGPYKDLKKFKANDWNELLIVVKGNTARCTCNGELLEEAFKVPAKGPIGVEGDRGLFEYRNIRVKRSSVNLLKPVDATNAWTLETTGEGAGNLNVSGDLINLETTRMGTENWHVQAYHAGLSLVEGATYKFSFEMKAESENAVVSVQAMINEADWHNVGLQEEVYPGDCFQSYDFSFTATDVSSASGNNRIGFAIGEQIGTIQIRNLRLIRAR